MTPERLAEIEAWAAPHETNELPSKGHLYTVELLAEVRRLRAQIRRWSVSDCHPDILTDMAQTLEENSR